MTSAGEQFMPCCFHLADFSGYQKSLQTTLMYFIRVKLKIYADNDALFVLTDELFFFLTSEVYNQAYPWSNSKIRHVCRGLLVDRTCFACFKPAGSKEMIAEKHCA